MISVFYKCVVSKLMYSSVIEFYFKNIVLKYVFLHL